MICVSAEIVNEIRRKSEALITEGLLFAIIY